MAKKRGGGRKRSPVLFDLGLLGFLGLLFIGFVGGAGTQARTEFVPVCDEDTPAGELCVDPVDIQVNE